MMAVYAEVVLAVTAVTAGAMAAIAPARTMMVGGVVIIALAQLLVWASQGALLLAVLDLLLNAMLVGWLLLRLSSQPETSHRTAGVLRAGLVLGCVLLAVGLAAVMPQPGVRDAASVALIGFGLAAALAGMSWSRRLAGFNVMGAGILLILSRGQMDGAAQTLVACIMLVAAAITALAAWLLQRTRESALSGAT
jgi:hypothetical protein